MHRRNPHVFGADSPTTLSAAEVNDRWQQIKQTDQPRRTPYDGIPDALPALLLATKVLERLGPDVAALPAAERPTSEEAVIGERLLAAVADALAAGVDPEQALRAAVRRRAAPTRQQ
jgi:XTP/dITP diphosphohydrolase